MAIFRYYGLLRSFAFNQNDQSADCCSDIVGDVAGAKISSCGALKVASDQVLMPLRFDAGYVSAALTTLFRRNAEVGASTWT